MKYLRKLRQSEDKEDQVSHEKKENRYDNQSIIKSANIS